MSAPNRNDDVLDLEQLDTPRHTQVGHWISFCPYVSPTARQLYVLLAGFVNHDRRQQGDTAVYPSMNLLAMLLGLSRDDKVNPYMDELIWLEAVVKRTQRFQGGMRARNIYGVRFNPPPGSGLPEGLDEILAPHVDMLNSNTTKQRKPLMSAHAEDTKKQIQHRRAEAKAGHTRRTRRAPAPDTDRTPENRGTANQDEQTKPQVSPYPRKEGSRTPESRGPVPPETGVEQDVGRTTRRGNKKNLSSPALTGVEEALEQGPVSDDGQAVADVDVTQQWTTSQIEALLPEDAKATGPGLERIAARCTELTAQGLDSGDIRALLSAAPKNNPDKALLRRTATIEDARACLTKAIDLPGHREDVDRVCEHLADTIAANGFNRPDPTAASWLRAARLMIDKDEALQTKIDADAIIRMSDWVAQHPFWHKNVLSMPTLRKQFERLAAQAREEHAQRTGNGGGYRPKHVKEEDVERYASTLEMSLDYVLGIDDPEYRKDLADANTQGGHEGKVAFRERVFGPRQGWSVRVSREHLTDLFARVRDAGYRLDENMEATRTHKKSWAASLAEEEGTLPEELDAFRERSEAEEAERLRAWQKANGAALLKRLGYGSAPEVESGTS